MKYKVLVIDDEPLIRMSLESGLSDLGYQVCCTDTIGEGLSLAARLHPDAVLLDNRVGAERGIDHITDFQKLDEDMILILMTAYGSVSQAVEAMKLGVSHYVQKPFDLDEIDLVITRAMEQLLSRRSLELMKLRPRKLLGESSAICRIRQEIRVLAENDNVDILICGETGTGKEVVVNTIHEQSSRHDKPLVKINCGAIPENLLESELFGHEKGSFTGADKTKKGLIELANGGTVFLDEVGELPLAMQAKLLTFLEDRSFKRVGGLQDIEVNIRVAAATNRDLEAEVQKGRFREDLYYRLNVMQIHIPPLRERPEDIPVLCRFYLQHFNRKFNKSLQDIAPEFLTLLQSYYWKGNVRELRNVMERCVLFSRQSVLTGEETGLDTLLAVRPRAGGSFPMHDLAQQGIDLKREVDAFERTYIDRAMQLSGGNLSQAAQLLGCTRFTLKRRLEGGDGDE
ncbi:MAG: sigma-54 dependent transcriptional regulator [Oscillospiraceae bacterium]|nr:sigma-54 dependent transcriptional regulator [Oscillospiraceae bacterium]